MPAPTLHQEIFLLLRGIQAFAIWHYSTHSDGIHGFYISQACLYWTDALTGKVPKDHIEGRGWLLRGLSRLQHHNRSVHHSLILLSQLSTHYYNHRNLQMGIYIIKSRVSRKIIVAFINITIPPSHQFPSSRNNVILMP